MSLVEQNALWLVPAFGLCLLMVYAMMECTVAMLARAPRSGGPAVDDDELRRRLLRLNEEQKPYRLREGRDADLELRWQVVDATWYELFSRIKLSSVYGARMLLDETRREVRWYEWMRTGSVFLGLEGWRPRFNLHFHFQSGYLNVIWIGVAYGLFPRWPPRIGRVFNFRLDTVEVKRQITRIIDESGWTFRPTHLWFQSKRRFYRLTEALAPAWMGGIPRRRLWGVVYPLSYALTIVFLLGIAGGLNARSVVLAGAISGMWWGIWGLVVWMLLGFKPFWRRGSRRSGVPRSHRPRVKNR